MAVYRQLLLCAGGGIVSAQQQADQAENTATALIGLGGTGVDCLRTIKTQVRSRLKQDDVDAAVPTYEHIRFLGVDADEGSVGSKEDADNSKKDMDARLALAPTEFFSIANNTVKQAFANRLSMQQRRDLDWLRWEDIGVPNLCVASAGGS